MRIQDLIGFEGTATLVAGGKETRVGVRFRDARSRGMIDLEGRADIGPAWIAAAMEQGPRSLRFDDGSAFAIANVHAGSDGVRFRLTGEPPS